MNFKGFDIETNCSLDIGSICGLWLLLGLGLGTISNDKLLRSGLRIIYVCDNGFSIYFSFLLLKMDY